MPQESIEIFCSYSHLDEELRRELEKHLKILEWRGLAAVWHDRQIRAGDEWENEIDEHLESADIILLLISPDFIFSKYCYAKEMTRAMERHEAGEARVIPIFLREVNWKGAPFGMIQGLPTDAKSVTSWSNRDEAFRIVSEGVEKIVESLLAERTASATTKSGKPFTSSRIPRPPVVGFVARRGEDGCDIVEQLTERLAPYSTSLVTLSGRGGIGKTTLAAETARKLATTFKGRIIWSSAEGRSDFALYTLLDDIITQLGREEMRTLAPQQKEAQVGALVAEPQTLIILDNYETIGQEARGAIEKWFEQAQCPALFTSRHNIASTHNISIAAMSREEARDYLERLAAQTIEPHIFSEDVRQRIYETAEANPYVMQWVVAQIDEAKEPLTVFNELSQGEGDAAQRVFDRSFNLPQLGDDGRSVLLTLSLFTPAASREALAAAAGFGDDLKRLHEPLKNLHALFLIKSLDQHSRFTIEGLTRTLAAARLSKDERASEFKERFLKYFRNYTESHARPTPEDYDLLEAEKDNLLKAMDISFDSGDAECGMIMAHILANTIQGMLGVRGYWNETIHYGRRALESAIASNNEWYTGALANDLGTVFYMRGDYSLAKEHYELAVDVAKKINAEQGLATTLHALAILVHSQGESEEARRLYNESLDIQRRLGDQRGISITLHQLAILTSEQGELEEAQRLYTGSLEIAKKLGDQSGISSTLHELGRLAHSQGELEEARRLYNESLDIKRRLGDQHNIGLTLGAIGRLAETQGDVAEAARLYGEALSIFERLNSPLANVTRENLERVRGES